MCINIHISYRVEEIMISFVDDSEHTMNEESRVPEAIAQPCITFVVPAPDPETGRFNVQLEDGRIFTVAIPVDCSVGDTIQAAVVTDKNTGQTSLLLIPPDTKHCATEIHNTDTIGAVLIEEQDDEEIDTTEKKGPKLGKKTIAVMAAGGIIGCVCVRHHTWYSIITMSCHGSTMR